LIEIRNSFGVPPPHALFASIYFLLRPVRALDDGRYARVALWSAIENSLNKAATAYGVLKTIRHYQHPRSYALHVRRFLLVWLVTLPIALASILAFVPTGAAFVVGACAWAMYSTDELAYLVGQPFDKILGSSSMQRPFFQKKSSSALGIFSNKLFVRLVGNKHNSISKDQDKEFDYASYEPAQPPEPSTAGFSSSPKYRQKLQTTFPLDEWADYLVISIRQHVLVHSVLDRRIKSRTWVVKPEACVQKAIDEPIPYEAQRPPNKNEDEQQHHQTISNNATSDDDDDLDETDPVEPDIIND